MTRIALTATALLLLVAPAAATADTGPSAVHRHQRQIVVRGTVLTVSPISVRASIGATVTCVVRNRELVANLVVGDHVRMKCVEVDGRLVLRRLAVNPVPPTRDATGDPAPERPVRIGDRQRVPAG